MPESEPVGRLKNLRTPQKILIIIFIGWMVYLVIHTSPELNYVRNCQTKSSVECLPGSTEYINTTQSYNGIAYCCEESVIYPPNAMVPTGFVSYGHVVISILIMIILVYSLLGNIGRSVITEEECKEAIISRIMRGQKQKYQNVRPEFPPGEIKVGDASKLRENLEKGEPFKWIIQASITNRDTRLTNYYMFQIDAYHPILIRGFAERATRLTLEDLDKQWTSDTMYLPTSDHLKEKASDMYFGGKKP